MQMKMEALSHLGSNQLIVSGEERAGQVDQNRFVARVPPHCPQPAGPHFSKHNNLNTGDSSGDIDNLSPSDVSTNVFSWIMHDECYLQGWDI
jgi:hypothetical protein